MKTIALYVLFLVNRRIDFAEASKTKINIMQLFGKYIFIPYTSALSIYNL